MFKKIFFTSFFLFCFLAFGEAEQENGASQGFGIEDSLPSLAEFEQNSTGLMTYYEALEKYREIARLEWVWGIGFTSGEIMWSFPLALEVHVPVVQQNPNFKWLFQAGGGLLVVSDFLYSRTFVSSMFQTGFKYDFSKTVYGSFKGGAFGLLSSQLIPFGGFFLGFGGANYLTMDIGIQFLRLDDGFWDWGVNIDVGLVIKKWWAKK